MTNGSFAESDGKSATVADEQITETQAAIERAKAQIKKNQELLDLLKRGRSERQTAHVSRATESL